MPSYKQDTPFFALTSSLCPTTSVPDRSALGRRRQIHRSERLILVVPSRKSVVIIVYITVRRIKHRCIGMHRSSFARSSDIGSPFSHEAMLRPVGLAQRALFRLLCSEEILYADVVDSAGAPLIGTSLTLGFLCQIWLGSLI